MKTIHCYWLLVCWKALCCYSCQLTNITIAVEREECEFCITVNATWCSGYCFTRDPVYKYPPVSSVQQTCTFKEVVYETVKIPGCGDYPESFYSYPVATECHCNTCDTDSTDCTVRAWGHPTVPSVRMGVTSEGCTRWQFGSKHSLRNKDTDGA